MKKPGTGEGYIEVEIIRQEICLKTFKLSWMQPEIKERDHGLEALKASHTSG